MSRLCARPGCNGLASATFVYAYAARTAWLEALATEPHPMAHDLCDLHADTLTVPRGWSRHDRRSVTRIALFDPSAVEEGFADGHRGEALTG